MPSRRALIPTSIRLRTRVRGVYPENDGWRVAIDMGGDENFDAVIVATPANVAGALLEAVDRDLADDLLGITYSSSVTVTLGYYMDQLKHLPPGFGFLVPRSEGTRMLACTFVHNKFPHRAPADKGILRCFLGGARDEAVLTLSDDEIVDTVRAELKRSSSWKRARCSPVFTAGAEPWRSTSRAHRAGGAHRKAGQRDSRPCTGGQCVSWHWRARLHSRGHERSECHRAGANGSGECTAPVVHVRDVGIRWEGFTTEDTEKNNHKKKQPRTAPLSAGSVAMNQASLALSRVDLGNL